MNQGGYLKFVVVYVSYSALFVDIATQGSVDNNENDGYHLSVNDVAQVF